MAIAVIGMLDEREQGPLYLKEIGWRFNHRNENLVKILRIYLNKPIIKDQL